MPRIDPAKLARYRALFALERLSPVVQSDVLSDGTIAKMTGLSVAHPIKIAGGVTLERPRLFDLLRKASDGLKLPSKIEDSEGKKHPIQIAIEGDAAIVTIAGKATRFSLAALLTSNTQKRLALGANCLVQHTLTGENRRAFEALIAKDGFRDEDFSAANLILAASPETFANGLHERAQTGQLAKADFLPKLEDHWNNLAPTVTQSTTLKDFIDGELAVEREAVIERDPGVALEVISLSFAAPEMTPAGLLRKLSDDMMLDAIRRLTESGDPFALTGAFDLCAERVAADARFIEVGDAILDKLFSDPDRLCRIFVSYGTAFVIATAHLAEHQILQHRPVYWRRLAAATHAALVARTLGDASEENASLLHWAMQVSGKSYYLSVVNDAHVEPRWRPDWLDAKTLAADVYGRLAAVKLRTPAAALPPRWLEKLAKAEAWTITQGKILASTFPAILQGASPLSHDKPAAGTPIAGLYETLLRDPTIDSFLMLTPIIWAFGLQTEARDAVFAVVQSLRSVTKQGDADKAEPVLGLAACAAVLTRDNELGELVSQICIERSAALQKEDTLLATVITMLESSAANSDRHQAIATLAQRLESLAFVSPTGVLDELAELLRILRSINEPLGNLLGRAMATARLGRPIVAA